MDTIGLNASEIRQCNKLYANANAYWLKKEAILVGRATQKTVDEACSRIRSIFATVGDSSNFHLVVAAERVMCLADLEHFQHSQQDNPYASRQDIILKTLLEGVAQMEEISTKLMLRDKDVQKFHAYSSGTITIKNDHDSAGLPRDGIRKLLSSHKTRLQNKNKGMDGTSNEERDLIWYRHRNIQKAEWLYKVMQREALGLEEKAKTRSRPR